MAVLFNDFTVFFPVWMLVLMRIFFNIFPLVFNEIENDEEIYPLSDVWIARHMQFEYNRSREGLRVLHRRF